MESRNIIKHITLVHQIMRTKLTPLNYLVQITSVFEA